VAKRVVEGVPYDECTRCGKTHVAYELLYEPADPEPIKPLCHYCIVGDAVERYGGENVMLGNYSPN
tara:strand:- start:464 stop:661 length:198 start_codon:yes stop_codon:yes gene_type:complete